MNSSTLTYNSILKLYASNDVNFRGRIFSDSKNLYRSEYQRDRDRVIHTSSFRRLKHKTQVFIYHEGDHFRTRLTHSLEVSQISRSIARYLGLNEDLCEVLSLAHDLGHTPFGHAGENVLSECMNNYGSFDHNIQSLRILTLLENPYDDFLGLNLSINTIDGLLKHNGPIQDKKLVLELLPDLNSYKINFGNHGSLESQISSLADDIAYNNHDIDDGLRANFFSIDELKEIPILQNIISETLEKNSAKNNYKLIRKLIDYMVTDLTENTKKNIHKYNINKIEDIYNAKLSIADFTEDTKKLIANIKLFLHEKMYKHKYILKWTNKSEEVIKFLFNYYLKNYNLLENKTNKLFTKERNICDFIAGMTDKYAIDQYNNLNK
jgi:dGTPase